MRGRQADVAVAVDDGTLTIYVDGSMGGSPRRGDIGIRFVWVNDDGNEEVWDYALSATMGAIESGLPTAGEVRVEERQDRQARPGSG
jgi:hypothetical protein